MKAQISHVRTAWNLREALLVILGINIIQLVLNSLGLVKLQGIGGFFLSNVFDGLLYIGGVYLFVRLKGSGLPEIGLRKKGILRAIGTGIVTGVITALAVFLLGILIVHVLGREPQQQPVQEMASRVMKLPEMLLFILAGGVVAPFKEEILFRGFLYPAMRDRVGIVWGIVLTSIFFAMVHGDLVRFIPLLIGGIALNTVYQYTDSLYSSIVAHGVWNLIMSLMVFWG